MIIFLFYLQTIRVFTRKLCKICFLALTRYVFMTTTNTNKGVSLLRIVLPCCRGVRYYVGAIGYCTKEKVYPSEVMKGKLLSNSWWGTWLRIRIQIAEFYWSLTTWTPRFEMRKLDTFCRVSMIRLGDWINLVVRATEQLSRRSGNDAYDRYGCILGTMVIDSRLNIWALMQKKYIVSFYEEFTETKI